MTAQLLDTPTARLVPASGGWSSVTEHLLLQYRRVWFGSAISTFLAPLLYLAGMGFGLGMLIDRTAGDPAGGAVDEHAKAETHTGQVEQGRKEGRDRRTEPDAAVLQQQMLGHGRPSPGRRHEPRGRGVQQLGGHLSRPGCGRSGAGTRPRVLSGEPARTAAPAPAGSPPSAPPRRPACTGAAGPAAPPPGPRSRRRTGCS